MTTPGDFASGASALPRASTGTLVGLKIAKMRQDLARLQNSIAIHQRGYNRMRPQIQSNAYRYQQSVAPIYARLQVGSTPGNPQLAQAWTRSELQLNTVNSDVDLLNDLGNQVASDASVTSYLRRSVRSAFGLSGAYEEDHRQLRILEDEVSKTEIAVSRLLEGISNDIKRQGNYIAIERANLTALALAIKSGGFFERASEGPAPAPAPFGEASFGDSPAIIIRFDRSDVNYEPALRTALNRALSINPQVSIDIVAIAPQEDNTNSIREKGERVFRSLTRMGIKPHRIKLSAKTGEQSHIGEVHVYIR